MRAVLQRVSEASVYVKQQAIGVIETGLLIFVGIEDNDTGDDIIWLSNKLCNLRIFGDENGLMNLSVKDIDGEILLVSQFTLHADTRKGNRPSFIKAAKPDMAIPLYEELKEQLERDLCKPIKTGEFGANMKISLVNEGPVTIYIDTKNKL